MSLPTSLAQHIARRPQRITLLARIAEQGSITRAAKAAGMSYKAAWDAIDELNNLAEQPLVERSVGGRGGGGARLTDAGQRLLALYQRLEALQAHLLENAESEQDLELIGRLMLRTSARNQLHGRVLAIIAQGLNDLIDVELPGGARLQAQITRDSTERLALQPGSPVIALFKAGSLELRAPGDGLPGRIERILPAVDGPSEVRIALPGGQTLCALVEPDRLSALAVGEGDSVAAQVAPSQVLLGTPL